MTWVRLRVDSDEEEEGVEGWEEVEEGVEEDWIELNQDVGPDKVGGWMGGWLRCKSVNYRLRLR